MALIEIKHKYSGEVLLSVDSNDGTLRGANLRGANLRGANLRGANLEDANLEDANLEDANLEDANLEDANLRDANLEDANLRDANLRDANLRDANLRGANLEGANLLGANMPIFCKWYSCMSSDYTKISIGCKTKTLAEWDEFFSSTQTYSTERGTEDFARIEATYKALKAYAETMADYQSNQLNNK